MQRLFKVTSVYRSEYTDKQGQVQPKVEVTLCYHECGYSMQNGVTIRKQYVVTALVKEKAEQCNLVPGCWIVGSVAFGATASVNEPGRMMQSVYLDCYQTVDNWDNM